MAFTYMERCMDGVQTSQSSDTVPHILAISWVRATHRDSYPLSASPLSITAATRAVHTSTLLPLAHRLSFLLLTFSKLLRLFFQTRLRRIQRREGAWPGSREERRGWRRRKEKREGGNEGSFVRSNSCILVLL